MPAGCPAHTKYVKEFNGSYDLRYRDHFGFDFLKNKKKLSQKPFIVIAREERPRQPVKHSRITFLDCFTAFAMTAGDDWLFISALQHDQ
jgi:hypothetical protein